MATTPRTADLAALSQWLTDGGASSSALSITPDIASGSFGVLARTDIGGTARSADDDVSALLFCEVPRSLTLSHGTARRTPTGRAVLAFLGERRARRDDPSHSSGVAERDLALGCLLCTMIHERHLSRHKDDGAKDKDDDDGSETESGGRKPGEKAGPPRRIRPPPQSFAPYMRSLPDTFSTPLFWPARLLRCLAELPGGEAPDGEVPGGEAGTSTCVSVPRGEPGGTSTGKDAGTGMGTSMCTTSSPVGGPEESGRSDDILVESAGAVELVVAVNSQLQRTRNAYDTLFPALSDQFPETFPPSVFTFSRWKWAAAAFSSRAFPSKARWRRVSRHIRRRKGLGHMNGENGGELGDRKGGRENGRGDDGVGGSEASSEDSSDDDDDDGGFDGPNGVMIPLIDMLNHRDDEHQEEDDKEEDDEGRGTGNQKGAGGAGGAGCIHSISSPGKGKRKRKRKRASPVIQWTYGNKSFQLRLTPPGGGSTHGFTAGEEVLHSYGKRCNVKWITAYGFCPTDNPHDAVRVRLTDMMTDAPTLNGKAPTVPRQQQEQQGQQQEQRESTKQQDHQEQPEHVEPTLRQDQPDSSYSTSGKSHEEAALDGRRTHTLVHSPDADFFICCPPLAMPHTSAAAPPSSSPSSLPPSSPLRPPHYSLVPPGLLRGLRIFVARGEELELASQGGERVGGGGGGEGDSGGCGGKRSGGGGEGEAFRAPIIRVSRAAMFAKPVSKDNETRATAALLALLDGKITSLELFAVQLHRIEGQCAREEMGDTRAAKEATESSETRDMRETKKTREPMANSEEDEVIAETGGGDSAGDDAGDDAGGDACDDAGNDSDDSDDDSMFNAAISMMRLWATTQLGMLRRSRGSVEVYQRAVAMMR